MAGRNLFFVEAALVLVQFLIVSLFLKEQPTTALARITGHARAHQTMNLDIPTNNAVSILDTTLK